jgi:hypothetical protein
MFRIEAMSSLAEFNDPPLGDMGGESEGGETGGEVRIEVGDETKEPSVKYESKP